VVSVSRTKADLEFERPIKPHSQHLLHSLRFDSSFPWNLGQKVWTKQDSSNHDVLLWILYLISPSSKNFGGLMTIRWFLGMSESAIFPLVICYQTTQVSTLPKQEWIY
jgi:hypothetical protein